MSDLFVLGDVENAALPRNCFLIGFSVKSSKNPMLGCASDAVNTESNSMSTVSQKSSLGDPPDAEFDVFWRLEASPGVVLELQGAGCGRVGISMILRVGPGSQARGKWRAIYVHF